jgi:hypothetical protein
MLHRGYSCRRKIIRRWPVRKSEGLLGSSWIEIPHRYVFLSHCLKKNRGHVVVAREPSAYIISYGIYAPLWISTRGARPSLIYIPALIPASAMQAILKTDYSTRMACSIYKITSSRCRPCSLSGNGMITRYH